MFTEYSAGRIIHYTDSHRSHSSQWTNQQDQQQDQQQAPRTPTTPRYRNLETSRDIRITIRSTLLFQVPYKDIREKLNVTDRQIRWAKIHRLTP